MEGILEVALGKPLLAAALALLALVAGLLRAPAALRHLLGLRTLARRLRLLRDGVAARLLALGSPFSPLPSPAWLSAFG